MGKLGFVHEPKQRYEDLLQLEDSLLPLMAGWEINSWRFLVMPRMVSFMAFARLSSSSNFASFPLISESPLYPLHTFLKLHRKITPSSSTLLN